MGGGELRDGTGEVVDRMPYPEHLGDEDDHEGEGHDDGGVEEGEFDGGLAGAGEGFDAETRRRGGRRREECCVLRVFLRVSAPLRPVFPHSLLPPKGTVIDGRRTIGSRSMKGIRSGTV